MIAIIAELLVMFTILFFMSLFGAFTFTWANLGIFFIAYALTKVFWIMVVLITEVFS